jgi:hypothetical protein
MQHLTIYGDFNCPYSYLVSARADELVARGLVTLGWRAVEHAPSIPMAGWTVAGEVAEQLVREVQEVIALATDTSLPLRLPSVLPNTSAAVLAFAGTEPTDAPGVRQRTFAALWAHDRDIGDPAVLSTITGGHESRQPEVAAHWQGAWLGIDEPAVPLLMLQTGIVLRGVDALERLEVIGAGGVVERHRRLLQSVGPERGRAMRPPRARAEQSRTRRGCRDHRRHLPQ